MIVEYIFQVTSDMTKKTADYDEDNDRLEEETESIIITNQVS
jgi:hypothetical protein